MDKERVRSLGVMLVTRNEWTPSGVVSSTERVKMWLQSFLGLFAENNHDLSPCIGVSLQWLLLLGW